MPSLYQFSAADAASAVDYSKCPEVEDGVVNSPPAKVFGRAYVPAPSPLRGTKDVPLACGGISPRGGSALKCPKSSRRLCMDPTVLQPIDVLEVPAVVAVSVHASVAPAQTVLAPVSMRLEPPTGKVVNLTPCLSTSILRLHFFILSLCSPRTLVPNLVFINLAMFFLLRSLRLRFLAGRRLLPRLIGAPSRTPRVIPTVAWRFAEVQGSWFRKLPRIPRAILCLTIRELVGKYGHPIPCRLQYKIEVIVVVPRFSRQWRPREQKKRRPPRRL